MSGFSELGGTLVGANAYARAARARRRVAPAEIDELGHMNNAVYLVWAQEIATLHWRAVAPEALQAAFVWVALRHEIDYRAELLEGDEAEVGTWLGAARGAKFDRHFDIRKRGADRPAAELKTTWALIDANTRRPRRIGPEILGPFGVDGK